MSRVPVLCRWLLKAIAPVVPAAVRNGWRKEWYGELWHWIDGRAAAGDPEAARMALSHSKGAISDAVYLRRTDARTRLAIQRVTGHPALSIVVLLLALTGAGAMSEAFSGARRLFQPLPYVAPQELVVLRQVGVLMGGRLGLPLRKIANWKDARTLQGIAAYTGYSVVVESSERRRFAAAAVDPDFFQVLGVRAWAGKVFHEVDAASCAGCMVVSYRFWRTVLGGNAGAIGSEYVIQGRRQRVIGVLPEDFWFFSDSPAVWTLMAQSVADPETALVYAIARVRPGIAIEAVVQDLVDRYWRMPPRTTGRRLEARPIAALTHDALFEYPPLAAGALFLVSAILVLCLPARAVRLRPAMYFVAKLSLAACVVSACVLEFVHARSLRISGVRGIGPETLSLWLLTVGVVIAISWAWHDQRRRCRTCLRTLAMAVQMGSRGHVLMDRMSTETVCPNGHGLLWAPEDPLESHPKDQWLKLDDSWKDLFEVTDRR